MSNLRTSFVLGVLQVLILTLEPGFTSNVTTNCTTSRNAISGVCQPISSCPASIALLLAGVTPDLCESEGHGVVCCPTTIRISAKKCEEFTSSVLTQPVKTKQALVFDGLAGQKDADVDSKNKSIICESFMTTRISGGRKAKEREYPYQVALGYGDTEKPDWRCGGTLIDPQFIVTAAHCIVSGFGPPIVALLGDRQLSKQKDFTRVLVNISDIFLHPKYKPPLQYYDIAIVKLEAGINISRYILPACLPAPEERLDRIKVLEVTGWGQTGALEGQSDNLLSTTINEYDRKECSTFFDKNASDKKRLPQGIISSQFCAGDKQGSRDTCKGDSGGPATISKDDNPCIHYLTGITSFGSNMCGYQQPGVYTKVLSYLDWIEDIVWNNDSATLKEAAGQYLKVKSPSANDDLLLNPLETTTTIMVSSAASTVENAHDETKPITEATPSVSATEKAMQPISTTAFTPMITITTPLIQGLPSTIFNISGTISNLLSKITGRE